MALARNIAAVSAGARSARCSSPLLQPAGFVGDLAEETAPPGGPAG